MPHRSSLFSSSALRPLTSRYAPFLLPSLSLSLFLSAFMQVSRRDSLPLSIIFRTDQKRSLLLSVSPSLPEPAVHVGRIPASRSRAIDKVILITEFCSSLISARCNHKSSIPLSLSLSLSLYLSLNMTIISVAASRMRNRSCELIDTLLL